jgi:hypothetical protein
MTRRKQERERWLIVVVFAVAMAWVEAATVYYLRLMTDRIVPYQDPPLPLAALLGHVELVREGATLLMLFTVGMLAAQTWRKRLAYALIAFGVWDIFYYVFLRVVSDWPRSPFDWDILFLLPLPWWGPVFAPVCIALVMILWGTVATQYEETSPAKALARTLWGACAIGVALALYVFMADALRSLPLGLDATRSVLPTSFNWTGFCAALALIAAPLAHAGWRLTTRAIAGRPPADQG